MPSNSRSNSDPPARITFVKQLADPSDIDAARTSSAPISKVRAVVFGYWNEPVSVEIATNRFSAIARSIGNCSALDQFEKNLASRGRNRIDVIRDRRSAGLLG